MSTPTPPDDQEAHARLRRFLRGETGDRLFEHPTCHPASPTGFCYCDHSLWSALRIGVRGWLLETILRLPFNGVKLWFLRRLGARIGRQVYISPGAWIDPLFPQLLTIEEEVFIGSAARIALHEFRRDSFRAGRVILKRGAFIGAAALLGCGIEVGEDATVAAGAVVGRDVPPGHTALGNPARLIYREDSERRVETDE